MEHVNLIREIKAKTNEDFVQWYRNTIQYTELLSEIIIDSTSNRYYNLFHHLEQYGSSRWWYDKL